jgi:ABC-type spermidine/putrescine transport system permease subunit II
MPVMLQCVHKWCYLETMNYVFRVKSHDKTIEKASLAIGGNEKTIFFKIFLKLAYSCLKELV